MAIFWHTRAILAIYSTLKGRQRWKLKIWIFFVRFIFSIKFGTWKTPLNPVSGKIWAKKAFSSEFCKATKVQKVQIYHIYDLADAKPKFGVISSIWSQLGFTLDRKVAGSSPPGGGNFFQLSAFFVAFYLFGGHLEHSHDLRVGYGRLYRPKTSNFCLYRVPIYVEIRPDRFLVIWECFYRQKWKFQPYFP